MSDLLIELLSEEIPARMQARAAEELQKRMTDGLVEAGLTYASAAAFATPRRLTLALEGLPAASPDTSEERKGPKVGAPDKAIEGFLRGAGVAREDLQVRADKKAEVYFAQIDKPGREAAQIVAEVLGDVMRSFPWPKSMRWGNGQLRWVRPLRRILCILSDEAGAEIVPFELEGFTTGDMTEGHRFMAPDIFSVTSFDDYAAKLKRAKVILNPAERAEAIWADCTNQAFAQGLEVAEDPGLLAEVAGLVEWPVVLMGAIDESFLDLPPEVLQTSMKEHQKFFSVRNPKTGRIEKFVTVANVETADNGAVILAGNQKVLFARLSDAAFFWQNDLRVAKAGLGLDPWVASLDNVTFHNKLGSESDRIGRITLLARALAPQVGADAELTALAARVAKADLASEMVYEFPELQGLMGRYYSDAAGLPPEVAAACQEHYSPLGPTDDVPSAPVSVAVALADKIDKLTGFWAIDEKPTGSKDPFALRRAALGVIRLITENNLRLRLGDVFAQSRADAPAEDLLKFFHDRLTVHLRGEGLRHDVIAACLAMAGSDDLAHVVARARALGAFLGTDDGENLLQGFKRANNILTQAEAKDGVAYEYGADAKFMEAAEEKTLHSALETAAPQINAALEAEDFAGAMAHMAGLRAPIDAFFEAVQVNSDNDIVRRNRLNMLHKIRETCTKAADLTQLEG